MYIHVYIDPAFPGLLFLLLNISQAPYNKRNLVISKFYKILVVSVGVLPHGFGNVGSSLFLWNGPTGRDSWYVFRRQGPALMFWIPYGGKNEWEFGEHDSASA